MVKIGKMHKGARNISNDHRANAGLDAPIDIMSTIVLQCTIQLFDTL